MYPCRLLSGVSVQLAVKSGVQIYFSWSQLLLPGIGLADLLPCAQEGGDLGGRGSGCFLGEVDGSGA